MSEGSSGLNTPAQLHVGFRMTRAARAECSIPAEEMFNLGGSVVAVFKSDHLGWSTSFLSESKEV